jgi:CubicO group peptidase (beta-lactamase class C family)
MARNLSSPEFEAFVQQTLHLWHVPGVAIAIVKDGKVIHCTGVGARDLSGGLPVTSETLFPIASCTKAFTTLAAGLLVEKGKLDWEQPVYEILPDFKLYDDVATLRLTVRDLLCHRSGLPGYDMLWYGSNFSRKEILRRLRYLEPSCDLRTAFQYQNLMFIVAGLIIEQVTGQSWVEFIRERILTPLGMKRSGFSTVLLQEDPDHSQPYQAFDDEVIEIPFFEADGENANTCGAGGIVSCASDMSRWLLFQLQEGRLGDTKLISPSTIELMRQPHVYMDDPAGRQRYGFEFSSYGLGWFLRMHKGQMLVWHDGNADGFTSFVALAPHRSCGVVVLSNGDFSPAPGIIAYTALDLLLDLKRTDWNAGEKAFYDEISQVIQSSQEESTRQRKNALPSHPLEAYLGEYEHPGYGVVSVYQADQEIRIMINHKLDYPLEQYHFDVFEIIDQHFHKREKASFQSDLQGDVCSLSVKMEPAVKEAVFTRLST